MQWYSPVAVANGSATAERDGEIEDESLAQLSGDSGDGSDGHLCGESREVSMVSIP